MRGFIIFIIFGIQYKISQSTQYEGLGKKNNNNKMKKNNKNV